MLNTGHMIDLTFGLKIKKSELKQRMATLVAEDGSNSQTSASVSGSPIKWDYGPQ